MDLTLFLFSCDSQCHLDVSNWLSFVQLLFADWLVFDGLHSICSDFRSSSGSSAGPRHNLHNKKRSAKFAVIRILSTSLELKIVESNLVAFSE